jgi:2-polyprenyl-6-methoxyphenol hydroxylase-like FAD-dependent oxidoreductase
MSDILVAGGGPAGAAAARLLALWGHDVRLVTTPVAGLKARATNDYEYVARTFRSATLGESLPPSCQKLFDVLGVSDAIDRAGFVRSTGNTVWWGEQSTRVESFASGQHGWQVTADALSAVLGDAARAAGVRFEEGRVTADMLAGAAESIVLDCTGRSGVVARARGWRVYEPALRTVALVGVWRRDGGWPVPDPSHTLIESYADGWMWSVPVAPSTRFARSPLDAARGDPEPVEGTGQAASARYIAAMVDPRSSGLAPASARGIYLAEIAKTNRFASLVEDAMLEGGPSGWDASMYSSTRYADDRVLLAGDAGSFIDPLSSAGVKKALASGWLAAVAAHTSLVNPAMRQTAFEFFDARERDIYQHFRALTQRFFSDAAAGHDHPFWTDRAGALDGDVRGDLADDRAVQAAFERMRSASRLAVRRGADVRVEPRPAVSGCEIVLEPRIVRSHTSGIRYLHDVDVVSLVALAPDFDDVGALFEAYGRTHGPVALPDFLAALAAAVANGWLAWRD